MSPSTTPSPPSRENLQGSLRELNSQLERTPTLNPHARSTLQALLSELQQAFEKNPDLRSHCRGLIDGAFDLVIDRARQAGVIRHDVSGADVTQLVSPVCTNPAIDPAQSERLMAMILDGLRYPAEVPARP